MTRDDSSRRTNKMDNPQPGGGQPVVSVVVPVFEGRQTIRAAVESALVNDLDLEVLVIDDGSLDPVRRSDLPVGPVRLITRPVNGGTALARNDGISAAKGELISFLDADDTFEPHRLDKAISAIHEEEADGVLTDTLIIDFEGEGQLIRPKPNASGSLGVRSPIIFASLIVRRDRLREVGLFDSRWPLHEDLAMWLSLLRSGCRIHHLEGATYMYRLRRSGKTQSARKVDGLWEFTRICFGNAVRPGFSISDRLSLFSQTFRWGRKALRALWTSKHETQVSENA